MAGRRRFSALTERMGPEARARVAAKAATLQQQMELSELRRAMQLSQAELARTLHVGQAAVAKIESRTDMYVSTLRRFIEAMGGELEITARFTGHEIRITNFRDVGQD